MRHPRKLVASILGCTAVFWGAPAQAQPDLPPPPLPPIEPSPATPNLPPPPQPSAPSPAPSSEPPARRAPQAPHPTPSRPRREVVYVAPPPSTFRSRSDGDRARRLALTLNPLALPWGRASGNVELLLAPHHAIVASPNVLFANVDRGGLLALALGFTQSASSGAGGEVGYHYWWYGHDGLRGPFFGPSLLVGVTSAATVGDPSRAQPYWGAAIDVGEQAILSGGFTIGGGAGLGLIRMGGSGVVFPRFLLQVGWSL